MCSVPSWILPEHLGWPGLPSGWNWRAFGNGWADSFPPCSEVSSVTKAVFVPQQCWDFTCPKNRLSPPLLPSLLSSMVRECRSISLSNTNGFWLCGRLYLSRLSRLSPEQSWGHSYSTAFPRRHSSVLFQYWSLRWESSWSSVTIKAEEESQLTLRAWFRAFGTIPRTLKLYW